MQTGICSPCCSFCVAVCAFSNPISKITGASTHTFSRTSGSVNHYFRHNKKNNWITMHLYGNVISISSDCCTANSQAQIQLCSPVKYWMRAKFISYGLGPSRCNGDHKACLQIYPCWQKRDSVLILLFQTESKIIFTLPCTNESSTFEEYSQTADRTPQDVCFTCWNVTDPRPRPHLLLLTKNVSLMTKKNYLHQVINRSH